jgi:hypothetical protein
VAETIRLYGRHFWWSLALGVAPGAIAVAGGELGRREQLVLALTAGTVLLTLSYVGACAIVAGRRPRAREVAVAFAAGALVYLPVPLLATVFVLPALAWLALVGLAVPAVVIERRGFRDAFARSVELARADYVHALGSLATLTIIVFLSQAVLFFLLRGQGDLTLRFAGFLASLVSSPLLFLGGAMLYVDQEARSRVGRRARPQRARRA